MIRRFLCWLGLHDYEIVDWTPENMPGWVFKVDHCRACGDRNLF